MPDTLASMTAELTPERLGRTLAGAADPELARVALSRVGEHRRARAALARPDVLPAAVAVLGLSTSAADFLVAHPDEVEALADVGGRSRPQLAAELGADVDRLGLLDGLRRFRHRAMLRIAARDLFGDPLPDVVREISDVADACIASACASAGGEGFAIIALGKLGGVELNYASDVDVIFVHAGGDGERERAATRVIRLLSEPTEEGIALRVDSTLRPDGRTGPLTRSLRSALEYYRRRSATWERQALIKARACAGDEAVGAAFVEGVEPLVYPVELEPQAIEEVRQVKVRLEEYVRARGKEAVEVKRGRGGIRDVEFAVQLLQVVHGRRDRRLRLSNTLAALEALSAEGYVAEADATALADAYVFLRRLEHRLQLVRDLQTHDLPPDRPSLRRLARAMGLDGPDALRAAYDAETTLVRGLHERLFYRPLLEAFTGATAPAPGIERDATEELLAGLGFAQPAASYEVLRRLVDPGTRMGKVLAHVFPVMAPPLALAANPDAALVRLERVADAVGDDRGPADILARDTHAARLLAYAVGLSSFATDLLVARTSRIEALSDGRREDAPGQLVGVAARYAARELAPRETGAEIARVADRVVGEALEEIRPTVPFAVMGLGKLGAEELNFASDLDLAFVYDGEGLDAFRSAVATAEAVMSGVRGAGWEPDADLRPEGRSGPLARSVTAFLEYWERWAEPWEFQSLLRARFVAGDEALGARFCSLAADFAYPDELTVDRVGAMRRMRSRIERERVRPPEASRFHFKLGVGSLADVQFAVELSLMRFGAARPEIRSRRTLEALERLAAARLIEDSVSRALGEAFVFCSDVKNALEVDRRVRAEAIPPSAEDQTVLARRLGYEEYPRQAFLDDYLRRTRRCRRAMERVFYEGP
jgi:[glutamine synthetase] adenylyltransferase / [glutamine synthetase]-adenylyl-L-tyrosine phosphorylase